MCISLAFSADKSEIERLRQQYISYKVSSVKNEKKLSSMIRVLDKDGKWPDIDYTDQNRSKWKTGKHLYRVLNMVCAYKRKGSTYYHDKDLKELILKSLAYWLKHDFTNPNWWQNEIGVPKPMADILLLMGQEVPQDFVKRAMDTSLSRVKIGMTGQNLVWLAGITYVKAMVNSDYALMKKSRDVILSELRVTTEEGIQPDWSFHQHGPQQQFGNYGLAFGDSMTVWGLVLRDSSLGLSDKQLEIMGNYLLEGPSWILWNGRMDISGCGRQLNHSCQTKKGNLLLTQLNTISHFDSQRLARYKQIVVGNESGRKNALVGNKHFWRSDYMVHRRPLWYASVKMSSPRVIGAETCNSENMQGLHLGDGAMYTYRDGDEYQNIFPLWDWRKLPGTTTNQSIDKLVPSKRECMLPSEFAGGVSDGITGIAALDYNREVKAKKSWFFLEDRVICLGAGITSNSDGQIVTSVEQALAGEEFANSDELRLIDMQGRAVRNNGITYFVADGKNAVEEVALRSGDWRNIHTTHDSRKVSAKVFSLYIDHGIKPDNATYAYVLLPESPAGVEEDLLSQYRAGEKLFLSNTPELQAVGTDNNQTIYAVFYKPGALELAGSEILRADAPCLVILKEGEKSFDLYVSDPAQKQEQITLYVHGRKVDVLLEEGPKAGSTVNIRLLK